MPATPARIGFITEEFRRATSGPDSAVVTRYGALARDTKEPIETFFDSTTDAQVLADERLALLKATRRLLALAVPDVSTGLGIAYQPTVPTAAVIDDERAYSADALIVSIEVDTASNVTNLLTWG